MPQLDDPNFHHSVVLLCQHDDNGAFGLVVNRPATASGRIVVTLDPPLETNGQIELWVGGPVEPYRSWMLVGSGAADEHRTSGIPIADGVHLSTSPDLLRLLLGPDPPPETRLILGYAGWGPGQLEEEFEASAWLTCRAEATLIFGTPAEKMWETALRSLGADPSMLQVGGGVH